jgi:AraC-like DNA-binding protein
MTARTLAMTETTPFDHLRVSGALFVRAEFTEPWAYSSAGPEESAAALVPGAERLLLFHVVARGRCWIALEDGDRHWAEEGDVIVLPYGDVHVIGGREPAEVVPVFTFLVPPEGPPPWRDFPVMHWGEGGDRTDIVCGYIHSGDPLFDPGMRVLPPLFVVRPDEAARRWVSSTFDYARTAVSDIPPRLCELLVSEVLRIHLATAPAVDRGLLAALRDPVLAPALAAMHHGPERKWTVAELATAASASPSLLDQRFRQVLGRAPIRYLADWRMHVAADLLATTELTVFEIARRVGYDAEEAFSRAFKRARGDSPSAWRKR